MNQYFLHEFRMGVFFNSDSLYTPQLVTDLKASFSNLSDWQLSRAPSFIDIFVFYLINLFVSGYFSIICFAIIQIVVAYWLVYKVFTFKFSTTFSLQLTAFSFLGVLILLLDGFHPYLIILKSAHHFSEYLVWGVLSIIYFKQIYKPTINNFILVILLNFIQIISDQLIVVHFLIPAVITSFILVLKGLVDKKKTLLFLIALVLSSIVALILSFKIQGGNGSSTPVEFNIEAIHNDFLRLIKLLSTITSGSLLVAISFVVFWMGFLITFYKRGLKETSHIYFLVMSFVTITTILILPNNNLLFRYLLPVLYTPVLLYSYYFPKKYEKNLNKPLFFLILTGFLHVALTAPTGEWNNEFYPDHVKCVDNHVEFADSKNIAGGFWDGRHISYLSKVGANVQPFRGNLHIDNTVSNIKKVKQKYSYVLIDKRNEKGLQEINVIKKIGSPNTVISCPNYQLFVYNENSLVVDDKGFLVKNEVE
ncbi:MAG: hypothetical protein R3E90_06580 [Marinicella sp.]